MSENLVIFKQNYSNRSRFYARTVRVFSDTIQIIIHAYLKSKTGSLRYIRENFKIILIYFIRAFRSEQKYKKLFVENNMVSVLLGLFNLERLILGQIWTDWSEKSWRMVISGFFYETLPRVHRLNANLESDIFSQIWLFFIYQIIKNTHNKLSFI